MDYLTAFRQQAEKHLSGWQFRHLHQRAHSAAGGVVAARNRADAAVTENEDEEGADPTEELVTKALKDVSLAESMEALGLSDEWALVEAATREVVVEDAPDPVRMLAEVVRKRAGTELPIVDLGRSRQLVYVVGLEPHSFDFQGDQMDPEEVEKTAHKFLEESRVIGSMHKHKINAVPVESYIAPQDLDFDGPNGRQRVTKGSWVLGIKIKDPSEWKKVVSGEYTGISVGGSGNRRIIEGVA